MNRMKSLIISLCMLVTLCSGCVVNKPIESEGKPPATELVLISQKETFMVNETYNLLWSFLPEGSEHEAIQFESSDPKIVSVDQNGKMTMLDEGTCTITGISEKGLKDNVKIKVERPKVERFEFDKPRIQVGYNNATEMIHVGDAFQIEWHFEPWESIWPEVVWTTDDTDVATVDEKGLVRALREGTAYIEGNYMIDGKEYMAAVMFDVRAKQNDYVGFVNMVVQPGVPVEFRYPSRSNYEGFSSATGFKYFPILAPLYGNEEATGTATIVEQKLADEIIRTMTFHVPDLYEIEVDGRKTGDTINCSVLVTNAKLPETLTLEVGDTYELLSPKSLKSSGEQFALSLESSNPSIGFVDVSSIYYGGDGKITALEPGEVTVVMYANLVHEVYKVIDSCVVTIKEKTVESETEIIPEEEKKEDATKSDTKPDAKPDIKPKPTPRPDPDDDYDPTPTPKPEVKVVEIQGVPEYVIFGKEIVLDDIVKVSPNNATYKKIEWSLVEENNQNYLGLRVNEDGKTILEGTTGGTSSKVEAKITNGLLNKDFVKEFYIKVLYDIDIEGYYDKVNTIEIKLNEGLDIDLKASNGAGGPYTFELKEGDKLPDGIELVIDEDDENKLSAQLKGSTSQVGEHSFTITVTDKDGNTRDFNFKLIVEAEENTELEVELTHTDLKVAKVNEVYSVTFSALEYEGELTFELLNSDLPGEFTIDKIKTETGNTATLTGTPTTAGTYTFTIRVSDESGKSKDFEYTLVVKEEATVSPENEIPTS